MKLYLLSSLLLILASVVESNPAVARSAFSEVDNSGAEYRPPSREELKAKFNPSSNSVKPCSEKLQALCDDFYKKTMGSTCSNPKNGIHCNTREGKFCDDDAAYACLDFTSAKGMYCSNGACSQYESTGLSKIAEILKSIFV